MKTEECRMKNGLVALAILLGACGARGEGLNDLVFKGFAHPVVNNLDGCTIGTAAGGTAATIGTDMEMYSGLLRGDVLVRRGVTLLLGDGMGVQDGTLTVEETAHVLTVTNVEVSAVAGDGLFTLGTNAWVFAYGNAITLEAVAGCVVKYLEDGSATAVTNEVADADGGAKWLDADALAEGRAVVVTGYEKEGRVSTITFRPVLDGAAGHDTRTWFRVSVEEGGLVKVRYAGDLAALTAEAGWTEETVGTATHNAACNDGEVWFTVVPEAAENADGAEPAQQFFRVVVE